MYEFIFDPEKNKKLIEERKISFEEVICLIDSDKLIDIVDHHNKQKYKLQRIYVIDIEGYLYLVPFEKVKNKIYLKTIFPSRKHTKLYKRRIKNEQKVY